MRKSHESHHTISFHSYKVTGIQLTSYLEFLFALLFSGSTRQIHVFVEASCLEIFSALLFLGFLSSDSCSCQGSRWVDTMMMDLSTYLLFSLELPNRSWSMCSLVYLYPCEHRLDDHLSKVWNCKHNDRCIAFSLQSIQIRIVIVYTSLLELDSYHIFHMKDHQPRKNRVKLGENLKIVK